MSKFKISVFGVSGLLILVIVLSGLGSKSNAQREYQYYTIKLVNAAAVEPHAPDASSIQKQRRRDRDRKTVEIYVPDALNFLTDPVRTLRQNGFAPPPETERHWRSLSVTLRRLANPELQSSPMMFKTAVRNEVLKNEVVRLQLPDGWIPVVGDLHDDGTAAVGEFLSDPVGSLRAQGVDVGASNESVWRQLAAALKALRQTYASSEKPTTPARDRFYRTKPHRFLK